MVLFFSSSIEVLRMQRENQQLRKTIDELKHSGQRIIELEVENEQLQKASLEGKTTVFTLNEVSTDCSTLHEETHSSPVSCERIFLRRGMTGDESE